MSRMQGKVSASGKIGEWPSRTGCLFAAGTESVPIAGPHPLVGHDHPHPTVDRRLRISISWK